MSDDPASHDAFKWEQRMHQIERLRTPWEGMGDTANAERAIAAITIHNLMAEVEEWRRAMQKAERDIAELRAERDEARREVCESDTDTHGGALLEAERRGWWDCFKEKP